MIHPLIETWHINARICAYLLAAIPTARLDEKLNGKGRSIGEQFAHIHNVRLMWLKSANPALLEGILPLDKENLSREKIEFALSQSAEAVAILLSQSIETGKIKGFKPHVTAFVGYLTAHEAHHRGQILLMLKAAGHPVDKKTQFGMWEWGVR